MQGNVHINRKAIKLRRYFCIVLNSKQGNYLDELGEFFNIPPTKEKSTKDDMNDA